MTLRVSGILDETRHKDDYGFVDSMAYDNERYIYVGTVAGVLGRIDTATGKPEKIANVSAAGRLPALLIKDGVLYAAGARKEQTQLIRWDTHTDMVECYTDLSEPNSKERPARLHDIAIDDTGRIYLGENDNHRRSIYLWEVSLE